MQDETGQDATLTGGLEAGAFAARDFALETQRSLRLASEEYRRAAASGRDFGRVVSGAFADVALKGRSLSDTLKGLALDMAGLVLKNATQSITTSLGNSLTSSLGSLVKSADGNVFAGGRVRAFAQGGVVNSPMLFPLQGGAGLAGEAGPEAIMPLQRGSDGRLGVAMSGGATTQIVFNVQATDAESFRRSQSQIAGMLSQMTARGQRNL
ncbi:MAG: phage tail tape measure protein [Rhizobiales bacterium]|nr:phage tail tape measure protein [Hyphomicrobiales bacterium]